MSTFVLFAQEECLTESIPLPLAGKISNNNNVYSGEYDIEYLENFEPKTFNIFFWGINKTDGTSQKPMLESDVMNVMKKINEFYNPYGICFVLKGYDYINNDYHYDSSTHSQIISYAQNPSNNYVVPDAFNCYVPYKYGVNGNGAAWMWTQFLSTKMYSNKFTDGIVVAHELGHNLGLYHTFAKDNSGNIVEEHVVRDINDPNYNASHLGVNTPKGDDVHDTPAMPNFKNTNWGAVVEPGTGHIIPPIDLNDCSYTGNATDLLGVPFVITPYDVGNIMSYSPQECQTHFTIGQAVRMYETIENYTIFSQISIPNTGLDLYIKDSPEDFGEEPNTASPYTWNSPDIWVRHTNDGQLENQNPEYAPNLSNYVYVRVTNRGCSASSGDDILEVYWSKAATAMQWEDDWNGENTFGDYPYPRRGDFIGQVSIPVIESGEEKIIPIEWNNIPDPNDYTGINPEPWHFCLLARIESVDDPIFTETTSTGSNVRKYNNIAQKNITIVNVNPNSGGKLGGVIAVGNPFNTPKNFTLNLVADNRETGKKIFEEAEVSVTLDNNLFTIWKNGGRQGNNIIQRDERTLIITGDNASLGNLVFRENEFATLYLKFNFLTQEVTQKEVFTYHVIQKETSTNEVIGGETYEIRKNPRALFIADAGTDKQVDKNEPVTLSAEMLNESAVYNWYDEDGNLIYEGASFTTSVEIGQKYKLEVIALADGYKDYAEVEVALKPNSITTLYPNPSSNQVTVVYKINEGDSAYLSVTGFYGSNISNNYILDITKNEVSLDVSNYPQGTYSIALIVNGQIQDTVTLIKQ